MSNNRLITIYITNFNYSNYIDKAIKSALGQTYKNFEIIIVDDNSKDNSKQVLKKYEHNKKISIIYNQSQKGLIRSANIAISKSKGSFFLRLDADDYLHKDAIKTLFGMIKNVPNAALVFSNFYIFNNRSKKISHVDLDPQKEWNIKKEPPHGACSLINKKFFNRVGGYNKKFDRQDGYYIWISFLLNNYKLIHCRKRLFYHRKHNKSLSFDLIKKFKVRLDILRFFSEKNIKFKNILINNTKKAILKLQRLRKTKK